LGDPIATASFAAPSEQRLLILTIALHHPFIKKAKLKSRKGEVSSIIDERRA